METSLLLPDGKSEVSNLPPMGPGKCPILLSFPCRKEVASTSCIPSPPRDAKPLAPGSVTPLGAFFMSAIFQWPELTHSGHWKLDQCIYRWSRWDGPFKLIDTQSQGTLRQGNPIGFGPKMRCDRHHVECVRRFGRVRPEHRAARLFTCASRRQLCDCCLH